MELAETRVTPPDIADGRGAAAEPSVSSALEHLMAGSQGVIARRIDLALLEGQELLSRTLRGAGLIGLAIVLAAGAWFAVAMCLVLLVTPDAELGARLAIFGLLNGAGAVGLAALATRARPSTHPSSSLSGAVSESIAVPSTKGT